MESPIKAAGYIRVSTANQAEEGESLTTQKASITTFAKKEEYQLTEIYEDAGISGGSMKERHALLKCLQDGQEGQFKVLIIHRLSRFGRNANELLNNYKELKSVGIELRSISEHIDFSSTYGEFMLTMLAAVAQLEKDIIRETTHENRIAKGRRGIPTAGAKPYGRTWDKETGKFVLDEGVADKIREAADKYLQGEKMLDLAKSLKMTKSNLISKFRYSCGDTWTVRFKGVEPMTYKMERILSDEMIEKVLDMVEFNRRNNRTDIVNKYVLSGFLRCDVCKGLLSGFTQINKGKEFIYYKHVSQTISSCPARPFLAAEPIERAVFETIFENFGDVLSFEKAIAESMPDKKMVDELELKIKNSDKELKRINRELNKLVEIALHGTLKHQTIQATEAKLLEEKMKFTDALNADTDLLNSLPKHDIVKAEAEIIRRTLLKKYRSKEHIQEMTYDEKRELLHWLFDGKDQTGTKYGIYVNKTGKYKDQKVDYFMYGRIQGLRTLKGDDINYIGDVDAELRKESENNNIYKTKLVGFNRENFHNQP
jgi:site-specific DNA recombinase